MLISTIQNDQIIAKRYMDLIIRMSCKHTRVWIHDTCKKSTVLTKKYWENTLLNINFVIHVHDLGEGKYLCISNYQESFILTISQINHSSSTLKRIPLSLDIDSSVTLKFICHLCYMCV